MENTATSKGLKAPVATLIVCADCYDAATAYTSTPTDAQRDAENAMMAKVGYYSHGGDRFHDTRDGEEATCQICWRDVDSYTVLWGSPLVFVPTYMPTGCPRIDSKRPTR